MAIVLPKDKRFLIGFRFPELIPFELAGIAPSMLLAPIFRLAMLSGQDASRAKESEATDISDSVGRLALHSRLHGFDETGGSQLLDRLVRSSLIRITRIGTSRRLQIGGITPYSIAVFKVGFPANQATFGQVDRMIYYSLVDQWNGDQAKTRDFLVEVFGQGTVAQGIPSPSVSRKEGEQPELDILTEMSLAYIDNFEAIVPKKDSKSYVRCKPLPDYQTSFGRDLYRFLWTYRDRVPRAMHIDQVVSLISFQLAILSVKLFHAVPKASVAAMDETESTTQDGDSVDVFVDLTADTRDLSRTMAVACMRRDISQIDRFIEAVLRLRYLHENLKGLRDFKNLRVTIDEGLDHLAEADTFELANRLVKLASDPLLARDVEYEARNHRNAILEANRQGKVDEDEEIVVESEADRLCSRLEDDGKSMVEQVQELLIQAQAPKSRDNALQWLRAVGGVGNADGLISGAANRRTWAYAPTNDLLMVLVQLCAVDYEGWNPKDGARPVEFGLEHFLDRLEARFGIIVDRPPADLGFDGPEYAAAARENLQALLRRLRQMGMFEDQSDDFSVQRITPPFMDVDEPVRDAEPVAR